MICETRVPRFSFIALLGNVTLHTLMKAIHRLVVGKRKESIVRLEHCPRKMGP